MRITIEIPRHIPHGFRSFVERAVRCDRFFKQVVESPGEALAAEGVPITEDRFTTEDAQLLIGVIGKLKEFLERTKVVDPFEFIFDDIFETSEDVFGTWQDYKSFTACEQDFSPNTRCVMSEHKDHGSDRNWSGSPAEWITKQGFVRAPLLSPGALGELLARMDEGINRLEKQVG